MQIPFFTTTGAKASPRDIPASLLSEQVNSGLIHQAVVRQQSNRRQSAAHVKTRGEVVGSTRKLFAQKHTGRARRGPIRSPVLRGGGKAFGPRNEKNYVKDMPKSMRHAAIRSCLTVQATKGAVLGLESYGEDVKTKTMHTLLQKLPVDIGRRILFVLPGAQRSITLSARNIPGAMTVDAAYLNPEQLMVARHVIFVGDALERTDALFGKKKEKKERAVPSTKTPAKKTTTKATKTTAAKKAADADASSTPS